MTVTHSSITEKDEQQWVHETRIGTWFLSTKIWYEVVLDVAIKNLHSLVGERYEKQAKILDIGCGRGQSFPLLDQYFSPAFIKGVDIDPKLVEIANQAGEGCRCDVDVNRSSAQKLDELDNSFDIVFCHQLIHHVPFREETMQEFYRILKPGGVLLLAESCHSFLEIYWVRWFFRHPKMQQKNAQGYIDLIRGAGFNVTEKDVLKTTPWWARLDLGITARLGLKFKSLDTAEIFIAATKPEE